MSDLSRPRHARRGDSDADATAAIPSMASVDQWEAGAQRPAPSSTAPIAVMAGLAIAAGGILSLNHSTNVLVGVAAAGAVCVFGVILWARRRDDVAKAGLSQLHRDLHNLRNNAARAQTALATAMHEHGQQTAQLAADNGTLRQQLETMNATFEHARAWYLDQLKAVLSTIPADMSARAALAMSDVGTDDPIARVILQLKACLESGPWPPAISGAADDGRPIDSERVLATLVDVGYRCQDVAHRAIDNIDTLIRQVADPDVLAPLFEIDHLITRVRRLSENLILIGGPPPRQWRDPCGLPTVIRSAKAEIEQYRRVDVTQHLTVAVHGHVVVPLVHLLAELLENAASFSKPETRVILSTRLVTAGVAISIQDEGLGMEAAALDRANEMLRTDTGLDRLLRDGHLPGLWVVGHLARTYEIRVQLASNIFGGITASVVLPHALLTTPAAEATTPATAPASPPEPGRRIPEPAVSMGSLTVPTQWPADETVVDAEPAAAPVPAGQPAATQHTATQHTAAKQVAVPKAAVAEPVDEPSGRGAEAELPPLPVRRPGKLAMAAELRRSPDAPGDVEHDSSGGADLMAGFLVTTQEVRGDVSPRREAPRSGPPHDNPGDAQGDKTR